MRLGALFDWDGVIIDSSGLHDESWKMLALETGKTLLPDYFKRGFGMKNELVIADILGWSNDPEAIRRYSLRKEILYRDLVESHNIKALQGVIELLLLLREHEIPCAVASSTHRENIETIFDRIGLREFFQAVVSGEDVSNGKPDPEVFLKGAEKIHCDPRHCVVFEDAQVGIEAALAAGSKVIAVATTNDLESLGRAHVAVTSLAEVSWPLFRRLFD